MKNNIYRRGKMWYVRFRVGEKRYNLSLGNDFQHATQKAPSIIAEKRGATGGSHSSDLGWYSFKGKFFDWCKPPLFKNNSIYFYRFSFDLLEKEFTTIRTLEDITPLMMGTFQSRLKTMGKSNVHTNKIIRCVKAAMRKAEEWELVKPRDWKKLKRLKEPKGKILYYTPKESVDLLTEAEGVWRTVAMMGLRLGLRRSEIFHARWENTDFGRKLFHVSQYGGWTPKDHETRAIPMPDDLIAYLKPLAKPEGFVLDGQISTKDVLSTYMIKIIKRAGLKGSLHTTRHTYASHLVQAGVPLKVVSELLGHSSITQTEVYSHLQPGNFRDAVHKLPVLLVPT